MVLVCPHSRSPSLLLGSGFVVAYPYVQFVIYFGAVFVVFGLYTLSQLPKRPRPNFEANGWPLRCLVYDT